MEHSDWIERMMELFDAAPEEWRLEMLKKLEETYPEPEYDEDEEY